MQAVILAGGLGTRMRPITHTVPKPMVEANGRPFLHYLIELVKKNGMTEILLLVGHLHEQVQDCFGKGEHYGIAIDYSVEESLLGTGGAVINALDKLQEEFILLNGDTYLPINYRELQYSWKRISTDFDGLLVLYDNRDSLGDPNAAVDDGRVTGYNKENNAGMSYIEAGAQIFKRNIFEKYPVKKVMSLEKEIYPALIESGRLAAYITDERFYDMGTPEKLKIFESYLNIEGN